MLRAMPTNKSRHLFRARRKIRHVVDTFRFATQEAVHTIFRNVAAVRDDAGSGESVFNQACELVLVTVSAVKGEHEGALASDCLAV
jgi:hypothetical protein